MSSGLLLLQNVLFLSIWPPNPVIKVVMTKKRLKRIKAMEQMDETDLFFYTYHAQYTLAFCRQLLVWNVIGRVRIFSEVVEAQSRVYLLYY